MVRGFAFVGARAGGAGGGVASARHEEHVQGEEEEAYDAASYRIASHVWWTWWWVTETAPQFDVVVGRRLQVGSTSCATPNGSIGSSTPRHRHRRPYACDAVGS
ncbi:hypothetical protein E2562_017726 [Oryza meyeriana var. granulata]|uniref:Uncharacterized protein n=1 Tax=Oryza meyeriana var. granulata TaxID=110450 RepID=A0A6G1BZE6_9ORYZ|nr:hypothetical protein E2562_017726 [Oryza meyeriana var. granulata]